MTSRRLRKVLVVDDEMSFTRLLKLSLEKTGAYEVRVVNEGARALASAREFKPDLILLDLVFPDMDGQEVASLIESDDEMKKIPIIFLTGFPMSKSEVRRPFLCKPLSVQEILDFIEHQLA